MSAVDTRGLRARLAELLTEHRVPGAALGLLVDDEVHEVAAGVVNVRTAVEATPDTVFQIGSITKVWTATIVMQLLDEGALDLDVPIRTYLPDFRVADPEVSSRVTLRHLLTHTSGIEGDNAADTGRGDDYLARFVEECAALTQTHPLGATMSYCNTGYGIVGRVLEVVSGTGFDQLLRSRLFEPLGLTHTSTLPEEAILHRVAVGHMAKAGEDPYVTPQWMLPRKSTPTGLINSTVREVLAFAKLHLDDGRAPDGRQVLSPGSVKAMQQPQVDIPNPYTLGDQWGLGWILFNWSGRYLFGHDGNTLGQAAFLKVAPNARVAVTLLTNGGATAEVHRTLFREVLADVAGLTMPSPPSLPATPPTLDLSSYEGTFSRLNVSAEVVREGSASLAMTVTLSGPVAALMPERVQRLTLLPVDDRLFLARSSVDSAATPTPVVFFDFADGRPQYFHMGARAMPRRS